MSFIKHKNLLFFLLIYFIFHILFINHYPVNFEYTFFNSLRYFDSFNEIYIKDFFRTQANTFGFSFFTGIFYFFFKNDNLIYFTRIISSFSYFLYFVGLINIFKYYKIPFNPALVIVFFFNPFIWNFGFRGTPDLFSSALAFFSSSFIIQNYKISKNTIFYLLLGIAITIKPHCGIFYIYIFLECSKKIDVINKENFYIFILIFIIPIFYFGYVKYNFNFFLIPPGYYNELKFNIYNFFYNFSSYVGYLNLAIFPFAMIFFEKINILRKLILSLFFFGIGFFFLKLNGELDMGPLSIYFKDNFFSGILFLLSMWILFNFYKIFFYNNKQSKNIIIFALLFVLVLSTSRPAQRYLITIIPMLYILFFLNIKKKIFSKYTFLSLLIYLPVNFILTANFHLNSRLSDEVLKYLRVNNYIDITNPGAVSSHIGYLFGGKNNDFKFIIESVPSTKTIKVFQEKMFFIDKKLYLNYL